MPFLQWKLCHTFVALFQNCDFVVVGEKKKVSIYSDFCCHLCSNPTSLPPWKMHYTSNVHLYLSGTMKFVSQVCIAILPAHTHTHTHNSYPLTNTEPWLVLFSVKTVQFQISFSLNRMQNRSVITSNRKVSTKPEIS